MAILTDPPIKFERSAEFSANETFRVSFPSAIGDSLTNNGVGKGDKLKGNQHETNNQYEGLSYTALDHEGNIGEDLNLITRSVASSEVSKQLGLNCVADEAYAKAPNGTNIGVSAFSSGAPVYRNVVTPDPATGAPKEFIHTSQINYESPAVQKGLYDLEAVDYLTGQIDRHGGNIFIDQQNGQVTGIDNDLCFGSKPLSDQDKAVGGKAVGKPPLYFHKDTADKIEQMSPEKLRGILEGVADSDGNHKLSPQEIDGAVQRLQELKDAIVVARAEGRVVEQFNKETFDKSVAHHEQVRGKPNKKGSYDATGSYLGRSQAELKLAKENVALAQQENKESADIIVRPVPALPLAGDAAALKNAKQNVVSASQGVVINAHNELAAAQADLQAFDQQMLSAQQGAGSGRRGALNPAEQSRLAQAMEQRAVLENRVQNCQELVDAVDRKNAAAAKVQGDRKAVNSVVAAELPEMTRKVKELDQRIASIEKNVSALTGIQYRQGKDNVELKPEEAALINNVNNSPDKVPVVAAGDVPTAEQKLAIGRAANYLRRKSDELKEQKAAVQSEAFAKSLPQRQALQASLAELEQASDDLNQKVDAHPIVKGAKEDLANLQAQQREVRLEQAAQRKIEEAAQREAQAKQELQQRREESLWQNSAKPPPVPPPLPGANDANNNNDAEIKPKSTRAALIGTNRQRDPAGPNSLRNSGEVKDIVEGRNQPAPEQRTRRSNSNSNL